MKQFIFTLFLLFSNTYISTTTLSASATPISVSYTGHDACRNKVWTGEYNIRCGASNSERTCRSTTLNCDEDATCSIKTQGSGHDAYQYGTVNAKLSQSFTLTCAASGFRDCQSTTIWCPQKPGSTCECYGCPSSVTMKCVSGVSIHKNHPHVLNT